MGARHFSPKNVCEKLTKCHDSYLKNYQNILIFIILDQKIKIPEFYTIVAGKIFPDFFGGGARAPLPYISYAYVTWSTH